MIDKLSLTVEFSADVEEEYAAAVQHGDLKKNIRRPFAFLAQPSVELLPPVTRYISPWGGEYSFILVEHRPYSMVYDSGSRIYKLHIPWSYTLFNVSVSNKKTLVHKFFRPTQLYSTQDPLFIPWYMNTTKFDTLEKGLDASLLADVSKETNVNNVDLTVIVDQVNADQFISKQCGDVSGHSAAEVWAKVYGINGEFLRTLEDLDQKTVVGFDPSNSDLSSLCIDDLHRLAVASSVNSVPTLREILSKAIDVQNS